MSSSTAFGPPFDHADADAVLRSSDKVDFFVYRVMLSISSPFFKSMFSLPQPISEKPNNPVIDVTENSRTIAVLLKFIYPLVSVVAEPESLDDLIDALEAARKYDMAVASQRLNEKFAESKVVQDDPIVAFCAAYDHKLGEAARVAAKASLKHRMNLDNIADKLQHINGPAFYQLYKFHRACSAAAAATLPSSKHLDWITSSDAYGWDFAPDGRCTCSKFRYTVDTSRSTWKATFMCNDYIKRARIVLQERPCREALSKITISLCYEEDEEFDTPCETCLLFTPPSIPDFRRLLGEEVEKRVSAVRHFLGFFLYNSHLMPPAEGRYNVVILTLWFPVCGFILHIQLYEPSYSEVVVIMSYFISWFRLYERSSFLVV
jgi:hypothetical protein